MAKKTNFAFTDFVNKYMFDFGMTIMYTYIVKDTYQANKFYRNVILLSKSN